jgi:iron complex outermembrane receptor protein
MKLKVILLLCVALNIHGVFGQNIFEAIIKDSETKEPLVGATAILKGTTLGGTSDIHGLVTLSDIPDGRQTIEFHYIGYKPRTGTFNFPITSREPVEMLLKSEEGQLH